MDLTMDEMKEDARKWCEGKSRIEILEGCIRLAKWMLEQDDEYVRRALAPQTMEQATAPDTQTHEH